ncbi:hypothetical protein BKA57DRAFT_114474 [Linnemannia elongata]|nr:hypothetical protein BKA57DRAFT_114474 [Linnemannia elongata]
MVAVVINVIHQRVRLIELWRFTPVSISFIALPFSLTFCPFLPYSLTGCQLDSRERETDRIYSTKLFFVLLLCDFVSRVPMLATFFFFFFWFVFFNLGIGR